MSIGVVGSGPAAAAVTAALGDVEPKVTEIAVDELAATDLAVVVAVAGETTFERANQVAGQSGTPWFAVELGGVGGYPVVDAAVSGFGPGTACYDCLRSRVGSNVEPDQEPTAAPDAPIARFAGAVAGRVATTYLDGDATVLGQVREVPHATRRLLPVPHCDCGSTPDRALEIEHVERDTEEALGRAEQALDDRVGIVREVGEVESFPAPYYLARCCDTSGFSDTQAGQEAAGVSDDWNAALMKALGEGLERYCAGVYRTSTFRQGTPADLDDTVPPSAFVTSGDPDFDARRSWVDGRNLQTDGDVRVPAELVFYPPHERTLRPAITTGLGLGNGTVEALLSGLYEVVERDATMLAWYSTYEPLTLSIDDERYHRLAERTRAEGLSVTPLLLTQDVDVPVVAVAVHRDGEWPRFALGSAARLDPAAAARSALAEAVQNWVELGGMGEERAQEAAGAIGDYAAFPERAREFVDTEGEVPASGVGPDEVPTGEAELEAVVERYAAADLDTYAVRTTTRDIAALGFEGVRVLCPSAQPLFFGDSYFGERASTVPETLGFEPRLDRDHHPFP